MDDIWQKVLPEGIRHTEGTPPDAPADFEKGYVLPVHFDKPLARVFADANADRLKFFEQPHVYTWDGVPTTTSVTALAHQCETPFDPTASIAGMRMSRSQAWPRVEYAVDVRPHEKGNKWDCRRGCLATHEGKTVAVVQAHSMFADADETRMRDLIAAVRIRACDAVVEDMELCSFERAMTEDEIRDAWSLKGLLARNLGTEAHFQAELALNGLPFRHWEPEMRVLETFVREHVVPRGITVFATEKEIVCPDADLAGSIDCILYDAARDVHHIVDFKRSDKLKRDLRGFGKMRAPFNHLDDCKGAGYALQLSIYQHVLEREYGLRIGDRILLSLHPDAPLATSVPFLKAEVEYLVALRVAKTRARRAVAKDAAWRCALTGAPLVDAARLEDGRFVMERAAIVRDLACTACEARRAEFEALVAAREETVEFDRSACVSWRRRVPEGGIAPFP